jgi:hypothetical protein
LLHSGVAAPEIERRLASRGLSPGAAAAVLDKVLGDRARRRVEPLYQSEGRTRLHRIVSGVVGAVLVVFAYGFLGTWSACRTAIGILLPLACIWFPDAMAFRRLRSLGSPVGGMVLRWGGWLVLLAVGIYRLVIVLAKLHGAW